MNLLAEQKQTHKLSKTYGTKGDRWGKGGMDWGFGIGICTLRYMECLTNGDLLYNTNSTQNYDNLCGKRILKRMDMCICMTESLCCRTEIHNLVNHPYFSKTVKKKKSVFKFSQLSQYSCSEQQ